MTPIYISSVLFEKNRWDSRIPSYNVSDWTTRWADAGFDGIELWENHLLLADGGEREAVLDGPLPVNVLNTYCTFDEAGAESRAASSDLARYLDAQAVKFNFGNTPEQEQSYIENLQRWRDDLPVGCRLLCECHAGTILETPETAAEILKPLRGQVEIIVHAFSQEGRDLLQRWLNSFDAAVTHIHAVLRERSVVPDRITMLKRAGFSGSCSVEFCKGVAEPPEHMDSLLSTAAADLDYLREVLP